MAHEKEKIKQEELKEAMQEAQEYIDEHKKEDYKEEKAQDKKINKSDKKEGKKNKKKEEGKESDEATKWKDAYIRKVAEFENFRKRKEKEKEDFIKYASEKLLVKTLEAVDNLERAVESVKSSKDFDGLFRGVEMTLSQFHKIMTEEGVEAIEAEGVEFNPYEHQAMMTAPSEDHEENTVIQEFQKGYKLKGKVIRPSMVKVCKK